MKQNIKLSLLFLAIISFVSSAMIQKTSKKKTIINTSVADTVYKIEPNTGLIMAPNYELVMAHCTACHSSRIILQYGANRETWLEKIRWMQKYHKLWDLGESEPKILDYLAKNYPPSTKVARRKPLGVIKWYDLNEKPKN